MPRGTLLPQHQYWIYRKGRYREAPAVGMVFVLLDRYSTALIALCSVLPATSSSFTVNPIHLMMQRPCLSGLSREIWLQSTTAHPPTRIASYHVRYRYSLQGVLASAKSRLVQGNETKGAHFLCVRHVVLPDRLLRSCALSTAGETLVLP